MLHMFKRAGMNLVLDVGSGAIHVLDAPAFALLEVVDEAAMRNGQMGELPKELQKTYGQPALEDAFGELCALVHEGLLYGDDDYREFACALGPAPVKAMCLHMAHDCNLRCKYCFASTGGFGGKRALMPFSVAKQAIDLLVALSEERHNLEVDFFGGEPLMNMDVVRQTVDYARSIEKDAGKNFRFTITTNGLALNDDTIDYINQEMANVVLSIDGRRKVHDAMRPLVNGDGSYDVILPKYKKLVAGRDKEYYVRGTYTRDNTDFDQDVLALFEAGFDQISVEPVVGPPEDAYTLRESDIPAIEESYARLMEELAERRKKKDGDFNFFHFMLDLENGPCAIKRLKGCGSGNEYLAVTPTGELYPCHQFVGNEDFIMGDVTRGITNPAMKEKFAQANLLNKTECATCWAKYFCSGGCNANNYNLCGDILAPHELSCKLEKIRLECAIALQAAVLLREN
ncbi:thioether cross-link-forming SCIFF peptide maturase [Ruminococcaceae bacterium OttesenSCG-928-O06]|nr:thioether cross-link-forming SCIFF peptide maturase [Ruminococcaceae bacterium OttesenSCG-928-O06]